MDWITRFSLKNSAAVVLVSLLVTAGGLWSASQLKKETMPDVNIPVVAIVVPYPGAAPGDVYSDVTEPLEKALQGVSGIEEISAQSGDSVSMVVAQFSFSQDMEKAEADIAKVLDAVTLPDNAMDPNISRISFGSAPILKLAIIGDGGRGDALRTHVREEVIPALQGVEGVGEARLAADAPAEIRIELDAQALKDEGLTADSVIQQLQASNLSFPVGAVDLGSSTQPVRVGGSIASVKDMENFRVAVYPNQNEIMGEAFSQIGEGMAGLGQAVGGLAQGMGKGFSALGEGMGQLGSATGEVGMQAGMINGMQQLQAQVYTLKYDTLPALKSAASAMSTDTPEYAQLQEQISGIEEQAIPGLQAAIGGLQTQVDSSQQRLMSSAGASAPSSGSGLSAGGMKMPASSGGSAPTAKIGMVKLKDVATVTYAPRAGTVGSRANGRPAALIDIVKTQDANTVDVSEQVLAEIEKLNKELPSGTTVETVYDASTGINASVRGMLREGLLGALFAVIVILLFLRNWRATIIATVSIPLSVLIAMVFLRYSGVTLNVMTLGGMTVAIGRVVDDSIVVIENIFRHMQRGDERNPEMVRAATREVSAAITSSTLTTVAVFIPLGLVTGVIGKIFQPFAITVALALLASLLVAVTIVPLMAKWFLLKAKVPAEHVGESKGIRGYRRALVWALDHRLAVVAGSAVLLAGSIALMPLIGTGFVPETEEKYLQVEVEYPEGTKSELVDKTVRQVEGVLAQQKEVELYQSTVGASTTSVSMSGGLGGSNKAVTFVRLDRKADMEAAVDRLVSQTKRFATDEARIVVQRVDSSGTNSALDIIVTGDSLDDIRKASSQVEDAMKDTAGLTNVSSNLGQSRKQLVVDVDQYKAAKYGMNAAMVAGTVRGFVAEQTAGSIKVAGQPTDIVYALALDPVKKAEEMRELELTTPLGKTIALKKIASVEETGSPIAILTRGGEQYAAVSGRITERDSGAVIKTVTAKIETLTLPKGIKTETSGAAEQMNESFSQLGVAMLVAIGAVYLVMILAFGEAVAPLAIMMSLPLAVVGGLVGLLIAGVPMDIPAMIGALMLIGIVVANAIVLIDRVQQKRVTGMSRREALIEAGSTRMRPILMTAVSTISALAPLAAGFSEGALISQSLAVIVIGGLTSSTILTLIVVPVAYDLLEGAKERILGRPMAEDELVAEAV